MVFDRTMFRHLTSARASALLAFGAIALAACGPASSAPATPAPATSAPATSAPATSAPATSAPATSATAGTSSAATAVSAATSIATDAVKLIIDPATSQARYHAREQLAGKSLPSDAVGTSNAVSGALVLGPDGAIAADQSQITVDLSKLQSDESRRDNFIKQDTLQTSRYPTAVFVPRQAAGLPSPLPTSGTATFQLSGDLTVHGVTKPVIWDVQAQFADAGISGSATTTVKITDFGMTPPRVGPVLSIEDGLTLELAFSAARG